MEWDTTVTESRPGYCRCCKSVGKSCGLDVKNQLCTTRNTCCCHKSGWVIPNLHELWCSTDLQVCLHHVTRLRLCMQHQVYGVALRHQQVPAVPEGVQHNHQHRWLTCRTHTPPAQNQDQSHQRNHASSQKETPHGLQAMQCAGRACKDLCLLSRTTSTSICM